MKILVAGGGGREHAIAWRLSRDAAKHEIFAAPGNAGMEGVAKCVDIKADDTERLPAWAKENGIDLVVVGPEAPLVKGLADELAKTGIPVFGPVAAGARIEGSKSFAKEIMSAAGVPTGKAEVFTDAAAAKAANPRFCCMSARLSCALVRSIGFLEAWTNARSHFSCSSVLPSLPLQVAR